MSEQNNEAAPVVAGTPPVVDKKEPVSPNADYKTNDTLDDKGNLIADAPVAPTGEPSAVEPVTPPKPVEFDSKAAKSVEGLLTDAGLTPTDVAKSVTEADGVTPEIMKALVEKHGEGVADLISKQLEHLHQSNKDASAAKDNAVYDQVHEAFNDPQGGEETFKELSGWAKENIPNEDRVEINKMLAQGGYAAKLAINDLVSQFKGSDSFTQEAGLEVADNLSNQIGGQPLDKAGYQREMRALTEKGHVYGQSQEMIALDKRRTAGLNRGI